ncbi:12495_t:CDS:2 [Ambispora gerdemannii]|uniref:12495_t:CDS:1 n=1 Tax=Ambispora gerdemannii TaxID=144530 RepID=A0A9N8UWT9_9GLOM|nr:12495_t:CDS:2 [Ambispora gerdemannii]
MKRIQKGPVRGISFKLQEEERERKDNYVPEVSALAIDNIEIDPETKELLKVLNHENLSGINVINPVPLNNLAERPRGPRRPNTDRPPRQQQES